MTRHTDFPATLPQRHPFDPLTDPDVKRIVEELISRFPVGQSEIPTPEMVEDVMLDILQDAIDAGVVLEEHKHLARQFILARLFGPTAGIEHVAEGIGISQKMAAALDRFRIRGEELVLDNPLEPTRTQRIEGTLREAISTGAITQSQLSSDDAVRYFAAVADRFVYSEQHPEFGAFEIPTLDEVINPPFAPGVGRQVFLDLAEKGNYGAILRNFLQQSGIDPSLIDEEIFNARIQEAKDKAAFDGVSAAVDFLSDVQPVINQAIQKLAGAELEKLEQAFSQERDRRLGQYGTESSIRSAILEESPDIHPEALKLESQRIREFMERAGDFADALPPSIEEFLQFHASAIQEDTRTFERTFLTNFENSRGVIQAEAARLGVKVGAEELNRWARLLQSSPEDKDRIIRDFGVASGDLDAQEDRRREIAAIADEPGRAVIQGLIRGGNLSPNANPEFMNEILESVVPRLTNELTLALQQNPDLNPEEFIRESIQNLPAFQANEQDFLRQTGLTPPSLPQIPGVPGKSLVDFGFGPPPPTPEVQPGVFGELFADAAGDSVGYLNFLTQRGPELEAGFKKAIQTPGFDMTKLRSLFETAAGAGRAARREPSPGFRFLGDPTPEIRKRFDLLGGSPETSLAFAKGQSRLPHTPEGFLRPQLAGLRTKFEATPTFLSERLSGEAKAEADVDRAEREAKTAERETETKRRRALSRGGTRFLRPRI
jgi:hypothetical protein